MTRWLFATLFLLVIQIPSMAQNQPGTKRPEASKSAEFDPGQLSKMAILVIGNENRMVTQKGYQSIVEDVFLECLMAKGHTIVTRSDVETLLKEKKFQGSGLTEENAAVVGKFLNVAAVLVLRITDVSTEPKQNMYFGKVSISARLLNVETGSILWSGKHSESMMLVTPGVATGLVLLTSSKLAEAFPDKKPNRDIPYAKPFDQKTLTKLAIITVGGVRRFGSQAQAQTDEQRNAEDTFLQVLGQKGYELVSRSDIQSIIKEQRFQQSGLSEDNAVSIGKLLNVSAVLMLRITDYANDSRGRAFLARAGVSARLIDVSSGEIIWAHSDWNSRETQNKSDLNDVLDSTSKDVADYMPPYTDSNKISIKQAEKLAYLGQSTAALINYQTLQKKKLTAAEKKAVDQQVKVLSSKK